MRVFVIVYSRGGELEEAKTYVIPCKDGTLSVGSLKEDVLTRCGLLSSPSAGSAKSRQFHLSLSASEAILSEKDAIEDVLQDGDFIRLGKEPKLTALLRICM